MIHVTAELERREIDSKCPGLEYATIPNGIEVPDELPTLQRERRLLFLSRIHPKKGLIELVRAFAVANPDGWKLQITGPDDAGHGDEVRREIERLGIESRVEWTGPIDGTEKWRQYSRCGVFVLPSHSENFGVVVGEALAAGSPVITTTATPWDELARHRCGWWIDLTVGKLAQTISAATSLEDSDREAMGRRGQQLIRSRYLWPAIGSKMCDAYDRLQADFV